ncbi:hypothetical protein KBD09_00640 [Candidatus Woesebacteria bacterium]|nr:hypothetical protein [Candidatus Woesebacteria bacterium]
MRNRILIGLLLSSGILLIILIGAFVFSLNRNVSSEKPLDSQNPPIIEGSTGSTNPNITETPQQDGPADPIDIDEEVDQGQRQDYPDIYLYNKIPFENQYFRIDGKMRPEGNPDFSFIATIKGQDRALSEAKLNEWLIELGLSPTQAAGLLIEYR